MKARIVLLIVAVLVIFVFSSCLISESSWAAKDKTPDSLREVAGLPSVSIGNLSPTARNPGLEVLCTGLYDVPGGYCNYFTLGVPFVNFTMIGRIMAGDKNEEAISQSP